IRTLVGLKMPGAGGAGSSEASDIAASIRWAFSIKSLADSASAGLGYWSVETPNEIRPGLFNGGSEMVFRNGWSQVNKSKIPCVGTVIAVNRETGGTYAVNLNMLASCQ
ncbi:MAG TPA: hypothetical protein VH369_04200, partial [Bryobacteraceae bacterium]